MTLLLSTSTNPGTAGWTPHTDIVPDGTAIGDLLSWDGTDWVLLPAGTDGNALISNGPGVAPTYQQFSIGQVITVGVSGADFTSVKDAVDSITDASITKPYLVRVGPGVFTESPFTIDPYIFVDGSGIVTTQIVTNNNAAHFITATPGGSISNCALAGPTGVGFATINHTTAGTTPFQMYLVAIRRGYYGIWCHPAAAQAIIQAFFVSNWYDGVVVQNFMRATDFGSVKAINCSWSNGAAAAVVQGYVASGANTDLSLDYCSFRQIGATDAVFVDDGAIVRLTATVFAACVNVIHVGATGVGTRVYATGCVINRGGLVTGENILIDAGLNPVFEYSGGTVDKNAITDNGLNTNNGVGPVVAASDLTAGEGGLIVLGELWLGIQAASVPVGEYLREIGLTGYDGGGVVTNSGGLTVDVTAGEGWVNTGTGLLHVVWSASFNLPLADNTTNYVYVDSSAVVTVVGVEPSLLTDILLATVTTSAGSIISNARSIISVEQTALNFHDYCDEVLQNRFTSGLSVGATAPASLGFIVQGGVWWHASTRETSGISADPCVFTLLRRDGLGGWVATAGQTTVPLSWDNAGVVTALAPGEWAKHMTYVCEGGDGTEWFVLMGQEVFLAQVTAEAGNNPSPFDWVESQLLRLYGTVVTNGAVSITSFVDARLAIGASGGGTTPTADHSLLANLGVDSHAQYLLLSGNAARNPMTGTVDATSGTLIVPQANPAAQTANGSVVWDPVTERLSVGDGVSRKSMMQQGDAAGGDVGGTFPSSLTVTDLTIAGEVQGDILYYNGANWVRLAPGVLGQRLQTNGAAANPTWTTASGTGAGIQSMAQPTASTVSPTTASTANPPTAVIPEMTVSFTPSLAANFIKISFNGTFSQGSSNVDVRVAIAVDGTVITNAQREIQVGAAGSRITSLAAEWWLTNLSAAPHTIDVRWSTSGGTLTAQTTQRNLIVVEYG